MDNPKYINCFTKTSIAASYLSFPKTFDSGKTWNNANRSAWLAWLAWSISKIFTRSELDKLLTIGDAIVVVHSEIFLLLICGVPYYHAYLLQKRWRILSVFSLFVNTPLNSLMYKGIRNNEEFKGRQVSIN